MKSASPVQQAVRRWAACIAALLGLVVVPVLSAPSASADLYDDPGVAYSSNRYWMTWCETYSSTIKRCWNETNAISTWSFNSLTYVGGTKAQWGTNPLANPGTWTSNGKQWKTECNTPTTGANGCRSYIWNGTAWVFNNMVRFNSASPNITWRPGAVTGGSATFGPAGLFNDGTRRPTHASGAALNPTYSGRTHSIRLRTNSITTQAQLDNCVTNPSRWHGYAHVVAHNYCNSWESDEWHSFRRGDRVTVYNPSGTVASTESLTRIGASHTAPA